MTSISINSKLDDIRSKIRILDDLIRPLNDLGMIRFFVEPHRIWINAVENNINLGQSPTMDEVEGMDETIDRNIEDTTGSILAEMSNCISRLEDRETIWKPDWMGEHIESLKKQTDATRTRASTVYPIDANLVREINGLRNGIKEAANFITHLDRANGILIASDSRIEILSGYANYMHGSTKRILEEARIKIRKIKERISAIKSNKPEGNLEKAGLELLQLIKGGEKLILDMEKSITESRIRNREMMNEASKKLDATYKLMEEFSKNIGNTNQYYREEMEKIWKKIEAAQKDIADAIEANEPELTGGVKARTLSHHVDDIYRRIEQIKEEIAQTRKENQSMINESEKRLCELYKRTEELLSRNTGDMTARGYKKMIEMIQAIIIKATQEMAALKSKPNELEEDSKRRVIVLEGKVKAAVESRIQRIEEDISKSMPPTVQRIYDLLNAFIVLIECAFLKIKEVLPEPTRSSIQDSRLMV